MLHATVVQWLLKLTETSATERNERLYAWSRLIDHRPIWGGGAIIVHAICRRFQLRCRNQTRSSVNIIHQSVRSIVGRVSGRVEAVGIVYDAPILTAATKFWGKILLYRSGSLNYHHETIHWLRWRPSWHLINWINRLVMVIHTCCKYIRRRGRNFNCTSKMTVFLHT
jgi:hypothetical protein